MRPNSNAHAAAAAMQYEVASDERSAPTTPARLRRLLAGTPFEPVDGDGGYNAFHELSGGQVNHVYRVTLRRPMVDSIDRSRTHTTVIMKRAGRQMKVNYEIVLGLERSKVEQMMLRFIQDQLRPPDPPSTVHHARVLGSLDKDHMIFLHDAGPGFLPLNVALHSKSITLTEQTARDLGRWLSALHTINLDGRGAGAGELVRRLPFHEDYRAHGYGRASRFVLDHRSVGPEDQSGALLASIEWCRKSSARIESNRIIHGDFGLSNILVCPDDRSGSYSSSASAFVVDFENSRPGDPTTDLARMISELYLVDETIGSKSSSSTHRAFVQGYLSHRRTGWTEEESDRIMVEMGVWYLGSIGPQVIKNPDIYRRVERLGLEWILPGPRRDSYVARMLTGTMT